MNIYVDEIPKSCEECPCLEINLSNCNLTNKCVLHECACNVRAENCPLHSLANHDKKLLENAIVLPKGFELKQVVYMIPSSNNGLTEIKAYRILNFSFSDIGCRADLGLCVKEKGVEPYYSAGFERFGRSIFATYEDAEQKLKELKESD